MQSSWYKQKVSLPWCFNKASSMIFEKHAFLQNSAINFWGFPTKKEIFVLFSLPSSSISWRHLRKGCKNLVLIFHIVPRSFWPEITSQISAQAVSDAPGTSMALRTRSSTSTLSNFLFGISKHLDLFQNLSHWFCDCFFCSLVLLPW